ncbi:hypothetical protein tf_09 [Pseudomonas phage tf]|uniref:Uncharacterized protein n=1 Tax=Pseudomonas phage tf TaxID=1114179 RepID=I2FLN0_9CAUD|nr:hypothetical protein tf_09 [Pseudomonas phage tf]CCE60764.1 hypothetical protein tf_09 [Pseudomonas phage tf]
MALLFMLQHIIRKAPRRCPKVVTRSVL